MLFTLSWRLQPIDLRNGQSYLGPTVLLDALSGRTHRGGAGPPFLRKFAVPDLGIDRGTFAELVRSAGSQQEDDHEDQAAAASAEPPKLVA